MKPRNTTTHRPLDQILRDKKSIQDQRLALDKKEIALNTELAALSEAVKEAMK